MKKLIPAICMTLVAAVMLASSTFAWFSMNTNVTATGMQVSAKTDNAFLIIASGTTLSGKEISANASLNASLYPVKPMEELTSATVSTVTKWGTATSNDPDNANTGATLTALDAGATFGNYVAKQSFMVGIVENSGEVKNDLKLKSLTISDETDGITVIVVCGTNIYTHAVTVSSGSEKLADKAAVTKDGVQVDVYIYIDGSNANVKTTNATNLSGTVELVFSIEA
ncbi:MAG: hypothetical protein ACI4S9_06290 [Christensenellales bacterium]